jgi:hypothetical protein
MLLLVPRPPGRDPASLAPQLVLICMQHPGFLWEALNVLFPQLFEVLEAPATASCQGVRSQSAEASAAISCSLLAPVFTQPVGALISESQEATGPLHHSR